MINLFYLLTFWLFTWYSAKLLKNNFVDQYWHIPQVLFLIAVYCLPIAWKPEFDVIYLTVAWAFVFPFFFNVGLNIYRRLPIQHLGRYDFLKFWQTVILFIVGIILIVLNLIKGL